MVFLKGVGSWELGAGLGVWDWGCWELELGSWELGCWELGAGAELGTGIPPLSPLGSWELGVWGWEKLGVEGWELGVGVGSW